MRILWILPLLFFAGVASAQTPRAPTVIIDVHARGVEAVASLKADRDVIWSAEFGDELLLGVQDKSIARWLMRKGARRGPTDLSREDILVRTHACNVHEHEPALALVGGYEILRLPANESWKSRVADESGMPVPADGVVARAVRNSALGKGTPAPPVPEVANLLGRLDADRWFDSLSTLATFNRNTFNPNLVLAHDWILQQFEFAGLSPETFYYNASTTAGNCGTATAPPSTPVFNPIGVHRGQVLPDEWIVVGAHFDSRNVNRCETSANPQPQPGANDNASGCAGVIELARVFGTMATRRSILFMCFSGEEQGLLGSRRYVITMQNSGEISKVKHMINLDMIAHAVDDNLTARVETTPTYSAVLAAYAAAASTYAPELNLITSTATGAYSDHWYFLDAQVPGAFTWENGASIYPQYHRADDLPQNLLRARPLAHGILKMDAAVLADLAGLLPMFADGMED